MHFLIPLLCACTACLLTIALFSGLGRLQAGWHETIGDLHILRDIRRQLRRRAREQYPCFAGHVKPIGIVEPGIHQVQASFAAWRTEEQLREMLGTVRWRIFNRLLTLALVLGILALLTRNWRILLS